MRGGGATPGLIGMGGTGAPGGIPRGGIIAPGGSIPGREREREGGEGEREQLYQGAWGEAASQGVVSSQEGEVFHLQLLAEMDLKTNQNQRLVFREHLTLFRDQCSKIKSSVALYLR